MATPHTPSILAKRHIRKIGEDLRVVRLRRRLPMEVVANRALVQRSEIKQRRVTVAQERELVEAMKPDRQLVRPLLAVVPETGAQA
ncbi:MAG: hypothetical protein J0J15_22050 [Mesorhizobium sp.]|nr:hypothetical protein [Mesorhizobium sp.]